MGSSLTDAYRDARKRSLGGAWLIAVASIVGFIVSFIAYVTPHGPIAQSWGALVVLISTALMVVASLLIALAALPRWFLRLLEVLIVLDVLGTGVCAYFLEAYLLLALMVVALLGCILHFVGDTPRISVG